MRERLRTYRTKPLLGREESVAKNPSLADRIAEQKRDSDDLKLLPSNHAHDFGQIAVGKGVEARPQLLGSFLLKPAEGLLPDRTLSPGVAKAISESRGGGRPLDGPTR